MGLLRGLMRRPRRRPSGPGCLSSGSAEMRLPRGAEREVRAAVAAMDQSTLDGLRPILERVLFLAGPGRQCSRCDSKYGSPHSQACRRLTLLEDLVRERLGMASPGERWAGTAACIR